MTLAPLHGAPGTLPDSGAWSESAYAAARRFVVVLLVLTVSAFTAEYAARFVFRHAHSSGRAGDFVATHGGGPPVVINSLGFRDREVAPRNPRLYRIVIVGDSFTWGQGIEARDRFSNLLADALGPGYEVLNFGRPGDDMPEHLDVLAQALAVRPDFVLLQLYINDFETKQMQRPRPYPLLPATLDRSLERSSVLYDLMNQEWGALQPHLGLVDSYEEYMARNLHDPSGTNSQAAFGMLNQFIDMTRRAGAGSGTVLFPAPDAMGPHGAHYPFGYLHERVAMTCTNQNIGCLDLLPAFSTIADPRSMWVSPMDAHPNAMANQRAARELLGRFGSIWRR